MAKEEKLTVKEYRQYCNGYKDGRESVQKEVEKLRVELTELTTVYSSVCERLFEIANTK